MYAKNNFILLLLLIYINTQILLVYSFSECYPYDVVINSTNIRIAFLGDQCYYKNWTLYKNANEIRTDVNVSFVCGSVNDGNIRWCDLNTNVGLNRLWSYKVSIACGLSANGSESGCGQNFCESRVPPPMNVSMSRRPPTSGGEVQITGRFLRFCSSNPPTLPLYGSHSTTYIKGDIEDPHFDCDNFTLLVNPGRGRSSIQFQQGSNAAVPNFVFYFAAPTIDSSKSFFDYSKSTITLNGDNFYINNEEVTLFLEDQQKTDFNITVNHTQIVVNNIKREYAGPIEVKIDVLYVPMDIPHYFCFQPIPESSTSVSSISGGIATISGKLFSPPSSTSSNVTIYIGNDKCDLVNSTSTQLVCSLKPPSNPSNYSLSISINGCKNTYHQLNFIYDKPVLNNNNNVVQTPNSRLITIKGSILGSVDNTMVQVNGNSNLIKPTSVSSDETSITFELPQLKCGNGITVKVINNGNPSNEIKFNAGYINAIPYDGPFVNNGSDLSLYLQYINCPTSNSIIPSSSFDSSTTTSKCTLPTLVINGDDEYYSTTCNVQAGTGNQHSITIHYNSQSYSTKFSYGAPRVLNYSITSYDSNINSSIVIVDGINFNSNISLFSASFNNHPIVPIDGSLKDNQFKFKLLDNDVNDYINIIVDGVESEHDTKSMMMIHLLPRNISIANETRKVKTHNDVFEINGINLLSTISNVVNYKFKVIANDKVCPIIIESVTDNSLLVSIVDGVGSFNLSIYIGDTVVKSTIIDYYDASIFNVSGEFNGNALKIIINGNNFGEGAFINIDQLSSQFNDIPCNTLIYHDDDDSINREYDQLICEINTNITTNQLSSNNVSIILKLANKQTDPINFILVDNIVTTPSPSPSTSSSSTINEGSNELQLSSSNQNGLTVGEKAGIAVGVIAAFALVTVLIVMYILNLSS